MPIDEKAPLKVFSCQVEVDIYNALIVACEKRGCTIRRFVRDALLEAVKKAGK